MHARHKLLSTLILASCFLPGIAQAYFSTIDTGDLIAPGHYQVSVEPQILLTNGQGLNVVGRLDTGIDDQSSVRGIIGAGRVDFQLGGFYKIVPFPDTPRQPAIGAEAGVLIARVGGETETSLRLHPLLSKHYEAEVGDFNPYASIPFGVSWKSGYDAIVPIQLAVGSEFHSLNHPNVSYFGELGVNLHDSFSYISGAVAFRFDDSNLPGRKR